MVSSLKPVGAWGQRCLQNSARSRQSSLPFRAKFWIRSYYAMHQPPSNDDLLLPLQARADKGHSTPEHWSNNCCSLVLKRFLIQMLPQERSNYYNMSDSFDSIPLKMSWYGQFGNLPAPRCSVQGLCRVLVTLIFFGFWWTTHRSKQEMSTVLHFFSFLLFCFFVFPTKVTFSPGPVGLQQAPSSAWIFPLFLSFAILCISNRLAKAFCLKITTQGIFHSPPPKKNANPVYSSNPSSKKF